ncbi:MAG: hypothetical protein ABJQ21_23005 [Roseibium sp.]
MHRIQISIRPAMVVNLRMVMIATSKVLEAMRMTGIRNRMIKTRATNQEHQHGD